MQLKFVPLLSQEERANLKPKVNDEVLYEGSRYTVVEAGLKYVKIRSKDSNALGLVKITEVTKVSAVEEAEPEPSPFDEFMKGKN